MVIFLWFKIAMIFALTALGYGASFLSSGPIWNLKKAWAKSCLWILGYRLVIEGKSPSREGPRILVGNHISFVDILVVIAAHPPVAFLAKEEVRSWPIIGAGAARIGTVFVRRESKEHRGAAKQQVVDALKIKSSQIVVFPTGTTLLDEELPWKYGTFEIAQAAEVPVSIFSISYQPKRESAYVLDDTMMGQLQKQLRCRNKSVKFTWIAETQITSFAAQADECQKKVLSQLSLDGAIA